MSPDHVVSEEAEVRLAVVRPGDVDAIDAAIRVGNLARATMGLMPFAGYHESAKKGTLLLAYSGERVVGYALYGLARRRVRLSHLCVDPLFRKQGIARLLVEWLSSRHADQLGISARCRHDYNLGKMWIRLGFTQIGERPGRSREGHIVVDWWRDHHHAHLFTADVETVLVRAAVDLNVLRDLAEEGRSDSDESRALLADHLVGLLELIRTAALDVEIDRMGGALRAQCTRQAQPLTVVRGDPHRVAEVMEALLSAARVTDPTYPHDEQGQFDLQHVADAVAAGLNVFVTRDVRLTQIFGPVAETYGLRIMRPVDVVVHIDELVRAESYRPVELLNTAYEHRLIGSGRDGELLPLVNGAAGERPRQFAKLLRDLAVAGQDRVGIYGPSGDVVATYCVRHAGGVVQVPLLRVAGGPVADTLARQLLFHLRRQARDSGTFVVRIDDPRTSPQFRLAALNDGFQEVDGKLYAFAVAGVGPALEIEHQVARAARQAGLPEPPPLRSGMPAVVAAEFERVWWPAKILDSELPTYLIPIRQAFSADLLGVPTGLLPRSDALGLNREHVYYKSPRGTQVAEPARLLWYMSEGGTSVSHPAAVIACSQLDAVVTGMPDEMYSRFQHLGVWNKATVVQAAHGGRVQALRFTNTEVFPAAIPRARLRELAQQHGLKGQPPQGPLRIPTELFAALYEEGRTQ
jgi:GNAT superfamily N-acetyltransferase